MQKRKLILITTALLLIMILLQGCSIPVTDDIFTVKTTLSGSKTVKYSIVNPDTDVEGEIMFWYDEISLDVIRLQTYADFGLWEYMSQVDFSQDSLIPQKSYKANIFYSQKEDDWSVSTVYYPDTTVISAVQKEKAKDKTAEKTAKTPNMYLDNEMVNFTLGHLEVQEGQSITVNVMVSESGIFAPYTVSNQGVEIVDIDGVQYECVKYTAKYAGFSLFTAKESLLWYSNDEQRLLIQHNSGGQTMKFMQIQDGGGPLFEAP